MDYKNKMQNAHPFLFAPPPVVAVPIHSHETRFPVHRIFCVGLNYTAHIAEMGIIHDSVIFFSKPKHALVENGASIPYPPQTKNLHHEVELVVAIQKSGRDIQPKQALDYVYGYAVGNDLTRRDLQLAAKAKGAPWDLAKGFDNSAVCGAIHPASAVGHLNAGLIQLKVNNQIRQRADLKDMIRSVPEIIHLLSCSVELQPGDLIFTGTPSGVNSLQVGDNCTVEIEGLSQINNQIVASL